MIDDERLWTLTTVATFVGGPLDGQTTTRERRWTAYRDDDNGPLGTSKGDTAFSHPTRPKTRYYAHQLDRLNQRRVYVHATVFDAWMAEQRGDLEQDATS